MAQVRTAQTIIKQALRSIGALATGETPDADTLSEGLAALQDLLASWSIEGLMVYYLNEREQLTLTAGTSYYTIGSGGTFDTTRPIEVVGAMGKGDNNVEYPYDIIDSKKYREITLKGTASSSYWLWYNPSYPLGEMYVYPTPSAADTLYLDTIRPLTEPSAITSNLTFPEGYNRALRYNLAMDLAPEYGHPLTPELIRAATEAKKSVQRLNAKYKLTVVKPEILRLTSQWSIDAC